MFVFMLNIINKLCIFLKFLRISCNNKNVVDRGYGFLNLMLFEIDDIEWFRKKKKCYVWFENERWFVNILKD